MACFFKLLLLLLSSLPPPPLSLFISLAVVARAANIRPRRGVERWWGGDQAGTQRIMDERSCDGAYADSSILFINRASSKERQLRFSAKKPYTEPRHRYEYQRLGLSIRSVK
ncbi:hypothetical protein V8C37DRAFT_383169 [Trichoderma ceciliae]